jgi:hypothetical protein
VASRYGAGAGSPVRSCSVAPSLLLSDGPYDLVDVTSTYRVLRVASAEPVRLHDEVRRLTAQARAWGCGISRHDTRSPG